MTRPLMTPGDDTEVTHSELRPDGTVKVYVEARGERDGFHSAVCWLPAHRWEDVCGYTQAETARLRRLVRTNADLTMGSARAGGVLGA